MQLLQNRIEIYRALGGDYLSADKPNGDQRRNQFSNKFSKTIDEASRPMSVSLTAQVWKSNVSSK